MTPQKHALAIYLNLYKAIGCEAKTKVSIRYMLDEIIGTVDSGKNYNYWKSVKEEINKL